MRAYSKARKGFEKPKSVLFLTKYKKSVVVVLTKNLKINRFRKIWLFRFLQPTAKRMIHGNIGLFAE